MPKPKIGITITYSHRNLKGFYDLSYARAVANAGGIPIPIPSNTAPHKTDLLLQECQGLLISGGGDIDPQRYGGEIHPALGLSTKERDALEIKLVNNAIARDIPLFGICRGHQVLNVALGGTLYTHIPDQHPSSINHDLVKDDQEYCIAHEVELMNGTQVRETIGFERIQVNSRHHQAILELAPGLIINARSMDGLIEGVEHPAKAFCIGVQWHPENLQSLPEHRRLFASFISAASGRTG